MACWGLWPWTENPGLPLCVERGGSRHLGLVRIQWSGYASSCDSAWDTERCPWPSSGRAVLGRPSWDPRLGPPSVFGREPEPHLSSELRVLMCIVETVLRDDHKTVLRELRTAAVKPRGVARCLARGRSPEGAARRPSQCLLGGPSHLVGGRRDPRPWAVWASYIRCSVRRSAVALSEGAGPAPPR